MKRYIKIPKDIQIVDLVSGEPLFLQQGEERTPWIVTFKGFIHGTILRDPRFGKTAAAVFSGGGIRASVDGVADGVMTLDGDDYVMLKDALETPESGYKPEVAIQLIPFFRAILDATTTDPRMAA